MDKKELEKAVSSVRDDAEKILQKAKEIASEENIRKAKKVANDLRTQEGREKAAESVRQGANVSVVISKPSRNPIQLAGWGLWGLEFAFVAGGGGFGMR